MNQLSKQPFFFILIPIFFVLHGFKENFGFIDVSDILLLILTYSAASIVLFLFFFIFLKNKIKSAIFAAWLISCYLFFGAMHDFLKDHIRILSRYSILLPLLIASIIILFIYLKRSTGKFSKITLYLNITLLIYLVIDAVAITIKSINPPANKFSIFRTEKNIDFKKIEASKKPDIYFLLFDEYASSLSLKRQFNFDNGLDDFLRQKGFCVQSKSYSNYNITPFSIASMLNLSYLKGLSTNMQISIDDYSHCHKLIRTNETINYLSSNGYNIINYSIFDLTGNPSPVKQTFLPLKTRLITDNTLMSRISKNLGWMLYTGPIGIKSLAAKRMMKASHRNSDLIDSVLTQSNRITKQPNFIYAHFMLPHDPFYFDKNGNLKNIKTVMTESPDDSKPYLEYLQYANTKIKGLIDTLQSNTKNNAVIILMGDHGFRESWSTHESYQNMNAVYLPGEDYHLFYDSISCVNQFRVIFNSIFNASFAIQKDSTVFLAKPN